MDPKSASKSMRSRGGAACVLLVFAVLLGLTLLVRLPDLAVPLERDEGEYAYAAQEIIRGYMPYTDSFCQKPPVVFLWYLTGIAVFGETATGIHLAMAFAAALAALGVYILVDRLQGETAVDGNRPGTAGESADSPPTFLSKTVPWFGAVVFAIAAAGDGYFGSAANTEIFMLVPAVFGTLFLLAALREGGRLSWFAAGFFFGVAFMTKQVALFSMIGPGLFAAWVLWRRERLVGAIAGPLLLGAFGALAAIGPLCGWLAAGGAFGDFLEAAIGFNVSYVGSPFGSWKWEQIFGVFRDRFLLTDGLLWACSLACFALVALSRGARKDPAIIFALLWLAGSIPGVALGPMTLGHYFLQVLPPLAVIAALFVLQLGAWSASAPAWARLIPAAAAAVVLIPLVAARAVVVTVPPETRSDKLYSVYGQPPFVAAKQVGEYLGETTGPGDRILVVGSEPEILFAARRRSATRFVIFYPLTGSFAESDEMCDELFREIEMNLPQKIVLAREGVFFSSGRETEEQMRLIQLRGAQIFSYVKDLLESGYEEEDLVFGGEPGQVLWKTRDGVPSGGKPPLFHIYRRLD
jgi:4-amino-4-deoxy-L-arabinose transferase-like glycosyltransferase